MTSTDRPSLLLALKTRWNRSYCLYLLVLSVCIALPILTLAAAWWDQPPLRMALGAAGLVAGLLLLLAACSSRFTDAVAMARHLNRTLPEAEESAELLLELESDLELLDRMQRRRIQALLPQAALRSLWPETRLRRSWRLVLASLGVTLVIATAARRSAVDGLELPAPEAIGEVAGRDADRQAVRLDQVAVQVRPPAYTELPERVGSELTVAGEEGSTITWRLRFSRDVEAAALCFDGGGRSSLELGGDGVYTASTVLDASRLYFVEVREHGQAVYQSEYARLEVVPDRVPGVQIADPAADTVRPAADRGPLPVHVRLIDDYGLRSARLVMTLTSGTGESVRFRERSEPIPLPVGADAGPLEVELELDLAQLGMEAGDELYFHAVATDNRRPEAREGRSETRRVRILSDQEALSISAEGIQLDLTPQMFRSQRQIIIDTEALLAEQTELEKARFQRRSTELGFDQASLRMRYGGLLGMEFESGRPVGDESSSGSEENSGEDFHEEPGHDHSEEAAEGGEAPAGAAVSALSEMAASMPAGFVHVHDSALSSTFFADPVRTKLQAALAQMWEAELRLRTFRPAEALPYEYRALELLKSAQEAERIYVQRVGFESPPLEPEKKRLTGELDEVTQVKRQTGHPDDGPADRLQHALAVVQDLRDSEEPLERQEALEVLRDLQVLLEQRALAKGGSAVPGLGGLRSLLAGLERGTACSDCLRPIEKAILETLPEAKAAPVRAESGGSELSEAYIAELERADEN